GGGDSGPGGAGQGGAGGESAGQGGDGGSGGSIPPPPEVCDNGEDDDGDGDIDCADDECTDYLCATAPEGWTGPLAYIGLPSETPLPECPVEWPDAADMAAGLPSA